VTTGTQEQIEAVEAAFPQVDWPRLHDCDRALNWELWHGPLGPTYWTEVEPLDHYEWRGWVRACEDLEEMLADLPTEAWWDRDCDQLLTTDPYDDEQNWIVVDEEGDEVEDEEDGQPLYLGPEELERVDPRELVLHRETWKQVF
jgi:hypothetical protein